MIRISLGNLGSGKTVCEVRNMVNNVNCSHYSNIITKRCKNNKVISSDMIIEGEKKADYKINIDFWKKVKKPVTVVLDEAHTILNPRRSMSKVNQIVGDWVALLRRIVSDSKGSGELVLITQLDRRIDVICREMATQVRWHRCHYTCECRKCGFKWYENSDYFEKFTKCQKCGHNLIKKSNFRVEILFFDRIQSYEMWKEGINKKAYFKRVFINDIEKYFPFYDTLQWDNLVGDKY